MPEFPSVILKNIWLRQSLNCSLVDDGGVFKGSTALCCNALLLHPMHSI